MKFGKSDRGRGTYLFTYLLTRLLTYIEKTKSTAQYTVKDVLCSARNGYPGTRVPVSVPVTRVPVR